MPGDDFFCFRPLENKSRGEIIMKISFSTLGCPEFGWRDIYSLAKDFGFDGIEVRGLGDKRFTGPAQPLSGGTAAHRRLPAASLLSPRTPRPAGHYLLYNQAHGGIALATFAGERL